MTVKTRVLAIGLDGFELSLAESMMAEGLLPAMAALRQRAARFELVHGQAKDSGLGWEHVSSGLSPSQGGRWSAVAFHPKTYAVRQVPTAFTPVFSQMRAKMVVCDPPYFDLTLAPNVRGLTNWGAHDPGVAEWSRPQPLWAEAKERFGPYCARSHIYGFSWPCPQKTKAAGDALAKAVRQRADLTLWLLRDRLPDWDLALTVVAETHSAIEPMWHGSDPANPMAAAASAPAAREALRGIYSEIDAMTGRLAEAFPDARLLLFSLHGMGTNNSDVAGMALLPELMFRLAFGKPYARPRAFEHTLPSGAPLLAPEEDWHKAMMEIVPRPPGLPQADGVIAAAWDRMRHPERAPKDAIAPPSNLEWMPAARYQPFWARMPVFALPAFHDGQLRLNLKGREAYGIVAPERLKALQERVTASLLQTRNALTGEPAIASLRWLTGDPLERSGHEPDAVVRWRGVPLGLKHPKLGLIGPYPMRRTGGHTSHRGFAWFGGSGVTGNAGFRKAFDIVPTLFALMGEPVPAGISGALIEPVLADVRTAAE